MGEEKHTGFRITPSLLSGGIAAGCYGDLIMCLYQQVKPYEQNPGETTASAVRWKRNCARAFGDTGTDGTPERRITGMPAKYFRRYR
ncbi:MAG: hypothetical protein ACLR7F_03480 [Waltera sp.]